MLVQITGWGKSNLPPRLFYWFSVSFLLGLYLFLVGQSSENEAWRANSSSKDCGFDKNNPTYAGFGPFCKVSGSYLWPKAIQSFSPEAWVSVSAFETSKAPGNGIVCLSRPFLAIVTKQLVFLQKEEEEKKNITNWWMPLVEELISLSLPWNKIDISFQGRHIVWSFANKWGLQQTQRSALVLLIAAW